MHRNHRLFFLCFSSTAECLLRILSAWRSANVSTRVEGGGARGWSMPWLLTRNTLWWISARWPAIYFKFYPWFFLQQTIKEQQWLPAGETNAFCPLWEHLGVLPNDEWHGPRALIFPQLPSTRINKHIKHMRQIQSTNKGAHLDYQWVLHLNQEAGDVSLNLETWGAKEQWKATWISGPGDETHVLLPGWVAASNLRSSRVRGKCLFNSIKGQFIMCILPGKPKAHAGRCICIISRQQQSRKGHWFIPEQAQVNLTSVGTEPGRT